MKKLINKPNVDGVSVDYPYGSMRDRSAGVQGSEMNTEFHTDYVQFFEKMFAESGLTASGLPDNFTNGFDLWNAFRSLTRPYKVYSATFKYAASPNRLIIDADSLHHDEFDFGSIVLSETAAGEYSIDIGALYTANFGKHVVTNNFLSLGNFAIRSFFDYNSPTDNNLTVHTSVLGSSPSTVVTDRFFLEFRIYD